MKIDKKFSDNKLKFSISFERESLNIVETPFGNLVTLNDCENSGQLGGPSLPVYTLRVALPLGHVAVEVIINVLDSSIIIEKDTFVAPLQALQPGLNDKIKRSTLLPNKNKSSVDPYPHPHFISPNPKEYEAYFKNNEAAGSLSANVTIGYTPVAIISILPVKLTLKGAVELRTNIEVIINTKQTNSNDDNFEKDATINGTSKIISSHLTRNQAMQAFNLTCAMVANPGDVEDLSQLSTLQSQVEYLIISDNNSWDPSRRQTTGNLGNIVSEFERLINWKRTRGLSARIVTISDIINGVYGQFNQSYSRDLQEVIHDFLKWARSEWGVTWLLLGGDIDIIPDRIAAGAGNNVVTIGSNDPPNQDGACWSGTFMKFNCTNFVRDPNVKLINFNTGEVIPYDSTGSSDQNTLGWIFTTNETYLDRSATRTNFIRINGPPSETNAPVLVLRYDNSIPTDLYYANLNDSRATSISIHAWDRQNNYVYGQHNDLSDFDGNTYFPDISVGRAPISSADEARIFVNKVLAYEQLRTPDGLPLDTEYLRKFMIVSDNWGGRIDITRTSNATLPPLNSQYFYDTTNRYTIIKLGDTLPVGAWRLIAQISETDNRIIPYNRAASVSSRGWRFCSSDTDTTEPLMPVIIAGSVDYYEPLPTDWVIVFGNIEELSPQKYIYDLTEVDGSLRDQEVLRQQIQNTLPYYNDIYRLYRDEVDLSPSQLMSGPVEHLTGTRLRNKMNEGQHFISLSGHGWWDGCCELNSDIGRNLKNGYKSFIVFADSCFTNEFNLEPISEILLNNPNGGAVAYVGNSRYSWIGVGDNFQRAFFRRLTSTIHLGLLQDMRCNLVYEMTGSHRRYNKWCIYSLNLMGDPEMPIWRDVPELIYLEYNSTPDKNEPFEVTTTTRLGRRLSNVLITLRQLSFFQQFPTDSQGIVEFDLSRTSSGPIEITAIFDGYKPNFAQAEIRSS